MPLGIGRTTTSSDGSTRGCKKANNSCRRRARASRTILVAVIVTNVVLLLGFQFTVLLGTSGAVMRSSASVTTTTSTPRAAQQRERQRGEGGGVGHSAVPPITSSSAPPQIPNTTTTTLSYHPWEMDSISSLRDDGDKNTSVVVEAGRCVPPVPVGGTSRSFCCVGSTSRGGMSTYHAESAECALGHTDAYERVRLAATEEMNRFPLRLMGRHVVPHTPTGDAPGGEESRSEECDACHVVDLARRRNWTIGFTGDSVHRQVFDGFLCELLRNGYTYKSIKKGRRMQDDWRHGIRFIHAVSIVAPHGDGGAAVTARFFQQYRPHPSMVEMSQIANVSDVLLFNFGVHWRYPDERDDYASTMKDVLSTLRKKEGGFAFLGYRETAAQHFRNAGGEYPHREGRRAEGCGEVAEEEEEGGGDVYGWRERIVRRAAEGLGFDVLTSDETLFSSSSSPDRNYGDDAAGGDGRDEEELLVVPFLNYTKNLGYLHKIGGGDVGDCTHYCSSPFLWAPLWRSVRIGVEYRDAKMRLRRAAPAAMG